MSDPFANRMRSLTDPAVSVFEITPNDATDLPQPTAGLNVLTPGRVHVTTVDGSDGTISVYPGHVVPVRVARVWQTGTTATGITGLV